jgi:o-succinylbenzoate synthase
MLKNHWGDRATFFTVEPHRRNVRYRGDDSMHWSIEPFSLSLAPPLETASGPIEERSGWLVRVTAGDEEGLGEATPLPGWTESYGQCRESLDGAIEALNRATGDRSTVATVIDEIETPAARHGCSLALVDLRARQAEEPLYRWLGTDDRGETRKENATVDAVPVNATVGECDPGETVDRTRTAVERGFDCVKLKIGSRAPEADAARLRAVRQQVGDGVTLRVDANGAWDRSTAREALPWLAEVDVAYLEQPLAADDLAGHATLRGGGVAIALDESLAEVGVDRVFDSRAADVLVCKPMVLGGVDRSLRVARLARDHDVVPIVTTTIDAAVARAGARHLGAALQLDTGASTRTVPPYGLATGERLAEDLVTGGDERRGGSVAVSQTPGHGLEL